MSLISGMTNQVLDYVYSVTTNIYNDATRTLVYTNLPCRWQPKVTNIIDKTGKEITSKIEVWIEPTYTIGSDYEFVKDSETYKIAVKEDKYDLTGNLDHIKLYLV